MESLWETNGKSMGSSCWLSLEYWLDQGQSIWFLTHWVNWSGHSMVYFLCIFLCLLSLYALFVTVISVCFLASFFQAVWSIPYLNSPLPIVKVSVLLEWIMKDHRRDNFFRRWQLYARGNFSGCFVLPYCWNFWLERESITTHLFKNQQEVEESVCCVFSPLHLKSNAFLFPDQRLWIRMVWLFVSTEQLVSSEVSEILVLAVTNVKFAFYYQISTKSLWTKISICWSQGCV